MELKFSDFSNNNVLILIYAKKEIIIENTNFTNKNTSNNC